MSESFREQLSRVELMASGDPTWDLSDNDIAALKAVLADRKRLAEARAQAHAPTGEEHGKEARAEIEVDRGRAASVVPDVPEVGSAQRVVSGALGIAPDLERNALRELAEEAQRIVEAMTSEQREDLLPDWFESRLNAVLVGRLGIAPGAMPEQGSRAADTEKAEAKYWRERAEKAEAKVDQQQRVIEDRNHAIERQAVLETRIAELEDALLRAQETIQQWEGFRSVLEVRGLTAPESQR